MKILKYLFFLILIILAGAAIYIGITDRSFNIEEQIKLKAPKEIVFKEINHLNNWKSWYWLKKDSAQIKFEKSDHLKGKNASLKWINDSLQQEGHIKTTSTQHYSQIRQSIMLHKKQQSLYLDYQWDFEEKSDTTTILLNIKGQPNYWTKAFNIIRGTSPKSQYKYLTHQLLKRLKKNIEQDMAVFSITVDGIYEGQETPYVFNSFSAQNSSKKITPIRLKKLRIIKDSLESNGIKINTPPLMIYNKIDHKNKSVIVSVGFPIDNVDLSTVDSSFTIGTLSQQKYITATLKGDYKNIAKLWKATKLYMQKNGLIQNMDKSAYEIFKIYQDDSKNPADWETQLFIPIKEEKTDYAYPTGLGI